MKPKGSSFKQEWDGLKKQKKKTQQGMDEDARPEIISVGSGGGYMKGGGGESIRLKMRDGPLKGKPFKVAD